MNGRHIRLDSPDMGRQMHVWTYGWWGRPLLVFPTAAGFAHEWQSHGMIEALEPLLRAGKIKLYCPESNVSQTLTAKNDPVATRLEKHEAYERFLHRTMIPFIREDCRVSDVPIGAVGSSLGGTYAALAALKWPEIFDYALCMSGRYAIRPFFGGDNSAGVYHNDPLAFVWNLPPAGVEKLRRHTRLVMVCGQGPWEEGCIEETIALCDAFEQKGIPHYRDIWGRDVAHDWPWWRKQAQFHLARRYGG